jgi:predicted PurR-regulated permease PerM
MKALLRWLNKKGISADALVIVLLVIGLAIAIGVLIYFGTHTTDTSKGLFNLTSNLKVSGGK